MSWRVHHANIPAYDVEASARFYEEILGMQRVTPPFREGYQQQGDIAWFESPGSAQIHLAQMQPNFGAKKGFYINPVLRGHTAITVADLDLVRERLRSRGHYFADPGAWALPGHEQIYFLDPSGNCLEINGEV